MRWGRPFHSPADCRQMCTRPGVSSDESASFQLCCMSSCNPRTYTGSAWPERRGGVGNQQLNMPECNSMVKTISSRREWFLSISMKMSLPYISYPQWDSILLVVCLSTSQPSHNIEWQSESCDLSDWIWTQRISCLWAHEACVHKAE